MTATNEILKTERISPIELKLGDRVVEHGALFEVMHITNAETSNPQGVRVAACTSRLIGEDNGAIPRGWFDTPESLRDRGCTWASELPAGHYWNVQGNALARVSRVVA